MSRKLIFDHNSLYENIKHNSIEYPNNSAYVYFNKRCSYSSFIKKIDICAKAFVSYGVKKGDIVSICMPNTPEAVIAFYALNKIGAIANMIHPLSAEQEIKYYLNKTSCKILVCIDSAWSKISNIIEQTSVTFSILVPINESMKKLQSSIYYLFVGRDIKNNIILNNAIYWKDFIRHGHKYLLDVESSNDGDNVACILYSSGTTGESKGIVHTNNNFNALVEQIKDNRPDINNNDSILAIMPVFHGFGLGICIHYFLAIGGKVILIPQFNNKKVDKLLIKNRPNVVVGVPTLFEALTNKNNKYDLSFIRHVISGGDALSPSLKEKVDNYLFKHNCKTTIIEGYGLTEGLAACCISPLKNVKLGSIGKPLKGNTFKIVDQDLNEVKIGEIGEICINGPTVMAGYYNDLEYTKEVLIKHHDHKVWLHTGDLGYMDKEGYVYFVQRLKRMIVSSGYNIYPAQIEKILNSNEYVYQSVVVGVPHPYKVQVAKAYIVLKENIEANIKVKNSIKETLELGVAKYAIPKHIEYIEDLPKNKMGKVDYKSLEKSNKKLLEKSNKKE